MMSLLLVVAAAVGAHGHPKSAFLAVVERETSTTNKDSPVTRVVTMLESLSEEVETDKKTEQDLFDKYTCWLKTVLSAKKASNSEAKQRIDSLDAYIEDIDSGRIEFSTEGADATKDVAELKGEIEKSANLRKKEEEDFEAAKEEMETSIAALEKANKELKEGTEGSLLAKNSDVITLGERMLSKSDAKLLTQELGPDHNSKYKAGSGKIKDLVAEMLQTFKDNLDQAKEKEKSNEEVYKKLSAAKKNQLQAASDALAALGGETASREQAKEEAKEEIRELEEQQTKDQGFMKDVQDAYDERLGLWKERKGLMTKEIASFSTALEILRGDEARDSFSKTYDNKIGLTQLSSVSVEHEPIKAAVAMLHKYGKAGDKLENLAAFIETVYMKGTSAGKFDKVMKALNNVKTDLNTESQEDLDNKEECETKLTEKTGEAQVSANFVDEKTRVINRTKFEVADLYAAINKTVEEVEDLEWALHDATEERAAANEAFTNEKQTLEAAVGVVKKAKKALEKFYEENGLALVQVPKKASLVKVAVHNSAKKSDPATMTVEAGKAPPPPPTTIVSDYKGHGGGKGIQGVLEEIVEDMKTDKSELEKGEKKAVADFATTKADIESQIETALKLKTTKEKEIAGKLDDISTANEASLGEKDTLDATVASLKAIEHPCDYAMRHFQLRIDARKEEAEGVDEAVKALGGDTNEVKYEEAGEK